jgi:hypothetical protein
MMPNPEFYAGILAASFAVCALFFLRFWRRTQDGLFLAFSLAFLLLAIQQMLGVYLGLPEEERGWIYVLRLIAFLTIIVAVLHKNYRR